MDVGDGRILMEEDRVEGFGTCLEEDDMEVFGSLNVNFSLFSTLKYFKRDLGIHKDFDSCFPLDVLECISSTIDLGTHNFFYFSL